MNKPWSPSRLSIALLLFTLVVLSACGGGSTPLAGNWIPDIYKINDKWENLQLDRDNVLAEQSQELKEGFSTSITQASNSIIKLWEKMNLVITIESATSFSFSRKTGKGSGICEIKGDRIILTPQSGAPFLEGKKEIKFLFKDNRLEQLLIQNKEANQIRPVLVLKRK